MYTQKPACQFIVLRATMVCVYELEGTIFTFLTEGMKYSM